MEVSMVYGYWRHGKHNDRAVFDLFFRSNPFKGEFTIFAGLEESIKFIQSYKFTSEQITYLRTLLPHAEEEFFEYLTTLDCSEVVVSAIPEGTVVFPRVPLIKVEGPLGICQLLETTLLALCSFASLMSTNAARFRMAAGPDATLLEFGLRRAQGPDGGMSASKYAVLGGFDGTSNVQAGMMFDLAVKGTHAHSFVSCFTGLEDLKDRTLNGVDMVEEALKVRETMKYENTNLGELAAFAAYAIAFPTNFLALVDTYDTLTSGVPNFICVALALQKAGYKPRGIRLDSGDLAYLSNESRALMKQADEKFGSELASMTIVASNNINEGVLYSLKEQAHSIDAFGIGTHLVTCQKQPALGMVYKLVEVNGQPRIKLSQELAKVTIPGNKAAYRLMIGEGTPVVDIMVGRSEDPLAAGKRILCRHPFEDKKQVFVVPSKIQKLLAPVWIGAKVPNKKEVIAEAKGSPLELVTQVDGKEVPVSVEEEEKSAEVPSGSIRYRFPTIAAIKEYVAVGLANMRKDHLRVLNPTPYKVSVSAYLFKYLQELWLKEVPIPELK